MNEQRTLQFVDAEDNDETTAIVRVAADSVGLTLSKRQDGDIEVFMPRLVAAQLADALREAAG